MSQSDYERYPDTTLPSVLPLPNPPRTPEQTVAYVRQLHSILAQNQARLAEIVRILGYHRSTASNASNDGGSGGEPTGGTTNMPPASESLVQHVDFDPSTEQARFFFDGRDAAGDPAWYEIGKPADGSSAMQVGFESQSDNALTWTDGTRTLEIDPTGTEFFYWVNNVRLRSTGDSVVIPDTEGLHHIYFDSDGNLQTSMVVTLADLIFDNAYVANVYWDATNSKAVFVGDERHGLMDPNAHYWIHTFGGGTAHGSGLGLGSILSDQSGALDTHAEMATSSGTYADEDIIHSVTGTAAPAPIPVMYKSGSTPVWRKDTAGNAPIKFSGGVPQINTFSSPNWGQTSVTNTKFFLMHIFVTNDYRNAHKYVAIQGEAEYNTVVEAQDGAETEISALYTDGLPMAEFLPIATVIYQYNTAYTNSYDCRIRATSGGDDYVNWLTQELRPGIGPTSHAALADRDLPDQHPADAVATDTSSFGGVLSGADAEVQSALDTLDDHDHDTANDLRYLKLDCSNDPLTADLEVQGDVTLDSGDVLLDDFYGLAWYDGVSSWYRLVSADSSVTKLYIGNAAGFDTVLRGATQIEVQDTLNFDNNIALAMESSGGTSYNVLKMRTDGRLALAYENDLYIGDYDGGTYVWIHKNDGDVYMSGGNLTLTTGDIDVMSGYADADDGFYGPLFETNFQKSMSNNVSQNFFKWVPTTAGDAMSFTVEFTMKVEFTVLGTTYYWTRGGKIQGTILYNGTNCYTVSPGVVWNGAQMARNAAGGTTTPTMNETVAMGAGPTAGSIGPYFLVNLATGYVSGSCEYWVSSTDYNHRGYVLFV